MTTNPLLRASTLPYELPPFAEIREEHYLPAFEQGLAEQLAQVEGIAGDPAPATFENTVVALERSGALLDRVRAVFGNAASADATAGVREIEAKINPMLAAHSDAIHLNPALFGRIRALYEGREALGLGPEELRLLERC